MGQVDNGCVVGCGFVVDVLGVFGGVECIVYVYLKFIGEVLIFMWVGGVEYQCFGFVIVGFGCFGLLKLVIEVLCVVVQVVWVVVVGEYVGFVVQFEVCVGDLVVVVVDDDVEGWVVVDVVVEVVEVQYYVVVQVLCVGYLQFGYDVVQCDGGQLQVQFVVQVVFVDCLVVRQLVVVVVFYCYWCFFWFVVLFGWWIGWVFGRYGMFLGWFGVVFIFSYC